MKKEIILAGVGGLLVGATSMYFVAVSAVNDNNIGLMRQLGMDTSSIRQHSMSHESEFMSMDEMSQQLEGKSGDDFDKTFLQLMITHHQGAIDMANLMSGRAKHDQIKQLVEAIILVQTKEINQMKQWQQDWGYSDATEMHGSSL